MIGGSWKKKSGDMSLSYVENGEKALLVAILERAIKDALGIEISCGQDKNQIRQANYWLFNDNFGNDPFCFTWITEALDIDPNLLRKYIKVFMMEIKKTKKRYVINIRVGRK